VKVSSSVGVPSIARGEIDFVFADNSRAGNQQPAITNRNLTRVM
jgi:hypothetical protein